MAGLLTQLEPMFVLQGLSCGLMFALMVVILGCLVLIAAAVGGAGLELGTALSGYRGHSKKREQRQGQDRQNQQQQQRQRMQQMQQRRADAQRRQQLAQQRLSMQRRHQ